MDQELARTGLEPLSRREAQVLAAVQNGLSNRQIAERISVCEDTVKYHLKHIFLKLGVRRRSEAVAVAVYNGLLNGFERRVNGEAGLNSGRLETLVDC